MATHRELNESRHQARRKLVSLVWHLSASNPDFKAAYTKADSLCAELIRCAVLQESIKLQESDVNENDALADVFTEGRA